MIELGVILGSASEVLSLVLQVPKQVLLEILAALDEQSGPYAQAPECATARADWDGYSEWQYQHWY